METFWSAFFNQVLQEHEFTPCHRSPQIPFKASKEESIDKAEEETFYYMAREFQKNPSIVNSSLIFP